ncbi:MAG: PLP-dependent aminotransferase family protein [Chloroflexi bacterium]|nr:PLP-dependent aminotransferase family protein [Chloroflexota bacterium]
MLQEFLREPTSQLVIEPGVIDLTWGHVDPALLPATALQAAAAAALARPRAIALGYGHERGPASLRAWLAERIARREGRAPRSAELMLTGGTSWAIDQVCALLTQPGDVVLVESPTYHLAVRILRDHPLELWPVPRDAAGIDPAVVAHLLHRAAASGRRVAFLYTVPTFHNPTGDSLPTACREALLALAARERLLILEDDVYRDLAFDGAAPPSLWSGDAADTVLRLGSFAKTVAPSLRLGWMTGPAALVSRIAGCGVLDSGGAPSFFSAMIVAEYCAVGAYERHVARLTAAYAARATALVAALAPSLSAGMRLRPPAGGFFAWIELPQDASLAALGRAAAAQRVAVLDGARFHLQPAARPALRLAFSLYDVPELLEGAARLARAFTMLNDMME